MENDSFVLTTGKIKGKIGENFSYLLNDKLVKKYNCIKNFFNNETLLEDGCLNEKIREIYYYADNQGENYIIIVTSTFGRSIKISKANQIIIDKKYNILEYRQCS